jgi:hypothetical protein
LYYGRYKNEIYDFIENDSNIREDDESHYLYPQYLYELLLQKKDANIEFLKPNNMGIKEYNYEWTRAFYTIFSHIVTEFGKECDG